MTALATTPTEIASRPRKKRGTSPTQRTLALLRGRGWTCQVVEQWNPHACIRQDLFGWIDIVALGDYTESRPPPCTGNTVSSASIIGIQTTSGYGGNHANRKAKMLSLPAFHRWIECGAIALLISWRKLKNTTNKDGSRSKVERWEPRIERLTLDDLDSLEGETPQ